MKKMICYEAKEIDRMITLINGLNMPVLDNANALAEIRNILESGIGGEMKEEVENGVEQQEVCKD